MFENNEVMGRIGTVGREIGWLGRKQKKLNEMA